MLFSAEVRRAYWSISLPKGESMNSRIWLRGSLPVLLFCLGSCIASAQPAAPPGVQTSTATPSVITIPPEAQPSDHFNVEAATNAYLAEIPADAKTRSDAYFEGGYWLVLWDFLYGVVIALLLLNLR
jgi:STE24 endopeptidase